LIQTWTCVEGVGDGEVAQSGARWLDLSGYQDVTFFLDVSIRTAECTMHYATSPLVDPIHYARARAVSSSPRRTMPVGPHERDLVGEVGLCGEELSLDMNRGGTHAVSG
jgi:hypothetical protein